MRYVRIAWVVLAIVVIGLDAAGAVYEYGQIRTVCTGGPCTRSDETLSPGDVENLRGLGISQYVYAGMVVGIQVTGAITFFAVSAVLFRGSSGDRMALLASFSLLVFGGAAFNSSLPQAFAVAHPALWFPVNVLEYFGQVAFSVFFLTFPDGRFVPRWTFWLAVLWAALFVPNVFFSGSGWDILGGPLFVGYVSTLVITQVYRYVRVSDPAQRQQTKWAVYGFALAIGGFAGILIVSNPYFLDHDNILGEIVTGFLIYAFILLIPISIAVAILRHRLYDIDLLINRTLVYLSLTAMLILVYAIIVFSLQYLLRALTGETSQIVIVASTLAIAALFNPLRRRIQEVVDRRFYRKKYDAARTLEVYAARLRNETDLDALNDGLASVVHETLRPAHASLWLREPRR